MANFPEQMALPLLALAGIAIIKLAFLQKLKRKKALPLADMDAENAEDKISQLPDDVLCSIIQQLNIKDAVRTSILSSRWKNLCARVPHVRFQCLKILGDTEYFQFHYNNEKNNKKYQQYMHKFVKAVDGYLRLYSGPKMISFHLACCFPRFCSDILEQWIHSVGNLGVEQLSLDFRCIFSLVEGSVHQDLFTFQCRLLAETPFLEHLRLWGCCLESNFTSHCNSLKVLDLRFAFVESGILESIFSSCLCLHSLFLWCCKLPTRVHLNGSLKFVVIDRCTQLEELEISASNLRMFEFSGERMIKFTRAWVPELEKLSFRLYSPNAIADIFGEIGRSFPHVKSVIIRGSEFQEGIFSISEKLNKLNSIRHMALLVNKAFGNNMTGVAAILDGCPFLESLMFMCLIAEGPHMELEAKRITHLKEVKFGDLEAKTMRWSLRCIFSEVLWFFNG